MVNLCMKVENLLKILDVYKAGTIVRLIWERDVSSTKAKNQNIQILKRSSGLIRTDVDYNSLAAVKEKAADSSDNSVKKESWFEHYRKGLLQSKKDPDKKYLQAFPMNGNAIKATFIVINLNDGGKVEVCGEQLYEDGLITKAALGDKTGTETFIVSVDNIISFGA